MKQKSENKHVVGVTMNLKNGDYDKMLQAGISVEVAENIQEHKIMNIVKDALKMPGEGVNKFNNLLNEWEKEDTNISKDIKIVYNGKYKLKYK